MMMTEDHASAEMEELRVRRLQQAFSGTAEAGPARSTLGRGLIASATLAALLVVGLFVAGVVQAEQENGEGPGDTTPTSDSPTSDSPPTTSTPSTSDAPPSSVPPPSGEELVVVAGETPWTDSGIDVADGDVVHFTADGIVAHAVGDPTTQVGPNGDLDPARAEANLQVNGVPLEGNHAGLIGRVGEGEPFVMGGAGTIPVTSDGRLFLGVNDNGVANNDGEFEVTIELERAE